MSSRRYLPGQKTHESSASNVAQSTAHRPDSWAGENLEHGLPFILFGTMLVAVGAWLALTHPYTGGSRLSLWVLLATIGVTLGGGGLALTLVDESPTRESPASSSEYVLVRRREWEQLKASRPAQTVGPPARTTPKTPPGSQSRGVAAGDGTTHTASPAIDPALVAKASDELLRASGVSLSHGSERGPPASVGRRTPPAAPPQRGGPAPSPQTPLRTDRPPIDRPWVVPPQPIPDWQEEPVRELESALAELEREATRAAQVARATRPTAPPELCVSCRRPVSAYSEQACVVCGHPLCEACIEVSVTDERPSICPRCAAPRPH